MNTITVKGAQRNLEQLIEQVATDFEPKIVIGTKGDQIVLVPLEEFNSWQETMYLLSSPTTQSAYD